MSKKAAASMLDRKKVLQQNRNVNSDTVAAHERLEQELKKIGVEIKPRFNVEPPLGSDRTGCYSRNSHVREE